MANQYSKISVELNVDKDFILFLFEVTTEIETRKSMSQDMLNMLAERGDLSNTSRIEYESFISGLNLSLSLINDRILRLGGGAFLDAIKQVDLNGSKGVQNS